jgi:hypothetical protein
MPRTRELGLLALVVVAGLLARVPLLYNAVRDFSSDEAVNALVVKRMLERGQLALHSWDAHYYGMVEGLLGVPFVLVLGLGPLAFKLGATVGFILLVVAAWALGRRLYGPAAGLIAAALVTVFSQAAVRWSATASAGFALIAAWGTLTFLAFDEARRRPALWKTALLGAVMGFGLYIYELYVVWLAVLALAAFSASFVWKAIRARTLDELRRALRLAPRQLVELAALAVGFLVGLAPRIVVVWSAGAAFKTPEYRLADPDRIVDNLRLLLAECTPSILGALAAPEAPARSALITVAGWLLVAAWGAIFVWAVARSRHTLLGVVRRGGVELDTAAMLVVLVPLTAALFVLSTNAVNVFSSRYLLPWLSALPILGGACLVRAWRRSPTAATLLVVLLTCVPLVQLARWYQVMGFLGPDWRLARSEEPLERVLDQLRERGIRGAYGRYWTTYKATFLSHERIVFGQFGDWQRNPEYTRFVDTLPSPAYVFWDRQDRQAHARFLELLRAAGTPHVTWSVERYRVYASPDGRRLLPPVGPMARPLGSFDAVVAAQVPASVRAGERLRIPVRVTNRGGAPWSVLGLETGFYRVSVSYRWLDEHGLRVIPEGLRTPLPEPVDPGASTRLTADANAPDRSGKYQLAVTLVQEDVAWFDDAGGAVAVSPVVVTGPAGP